jgi:L-threonylcarbamoyladenylate synthase
MATKEKIKKAAKILRSGGVIAFPTETVFGIGACLDKPQAIKRIFKIKKRPRNKPLQILISSLRQASKMGEFDLIKLRFAKRNWPGPLTLVVKKTGVVPKLATGGSNKVGLRMPAHRTALELIRKCGPIVATSANISGEEPFLNAGQVKKSLKGLDYIISGRVKLGKASNVIDATKGFKVLRS